MWILRFQHSSIQPPLHISSGAATLRVTMRSAWRMAPLFPAATTHYTWSMAQRVRDQLDEAGAVSPNVKLGILGPKWRQERNFWIAVLCFTAWLCAPPPLCQLQANFRRQCANLFFTANLAQWDAQ